MGMLHNLHLSHLFQNREIYWFRVDIYFTPSQHALLVPWNRTIISFMKVPGDGQIIPDSPRPLTFVDQNALQPEFQKCSILRICSVTQAVLYLQAFKFLGQCGWGISSSGMWCSITSQKNWYPSPTFVYAVWRKFYNHSEELLIPLILYMT
jgi:hypothetical protein